jgi:hypothetical protein
MSRTPRLIKALQLSMALACAAYASLAHPQAGTREAMADAMTRMMEAMGLFSPGSAGSMPMGTPFGGSGWTPGFGLPGATPWGMPFQDPSGAMGKGGEMMNQFSKNMPLPGGGAGMQPFPWMGSRLDGVWEGRDGELLIVQGNRFRIYPGHTGYVDGYLNVSGDRLAMYSPADEAARPFEFAESEGRLVLRDEAGQLFLYRRLWLETSPTQPGTGTSSER